MSKHKPPKPAAPTVPRPATPNPAISDQLAPHLLAPALAAGRDPRPNRAQREDGWTPDRIRAFLYALAESGVVTDAARAAGMSPQSAYALRNRPAGRAFLTAWRAAQLLARRRLADEVMARAVNGCVELIYRDGELWRERHRYDNRLTMAVLTRLDNLARCNDGEDVGARFVAEEFDQFVEIVAEGGEGAADFMAHRVDLGHRGHWEDMVLGRDRNFRRFGAGHSGDLKSGDPHAGPDPAGPDRWSLHDKLRAERAGLAHILAGAKSHIENGADPAQPPAGPQRGEKHQWQV